MNRRSALRRAMVITACTSLLVTTTPRRTQAQGLTEYALILQLIAIIVISIDELPPQNRGPAQVLINDLEAAINSAALAQSNGSVTGQISGLSKAIGLAAALNGLASNCGDCGQFNSALQQIIERATTLRASLLPTRK